MLARHVNPEGAPYGVEVPGRSLEPRSNVRPRGMTVLPVLTGRQNSAYRSDCQELFLFCFA